MRSSVDRHVINPVVFADPAFDAHEQVVFCSDGETGLRAIIAIHNTALGPALGGTRMWSYLSEAAALADALRLARGMTYKNALANLSHGGGKAVIIGTADTDRKSELLRAFARHVDRLGGCFITGQDVGLTLADVDVIAEVTPHVRGGTKGRVGDPSPSTTLGVFKGIAAAVAHQLCSTNLEGLSVCVQGLGAVGMRLCRMLHLAGAVLTVSDIREAAVRQAQEKFGATVVDPRHAHAADVDVFAPCALGAVLDHRTVPEIRARVVAGAANNQLATAADGELLWKRGILYAPDYVINAGGVIAIAQDGPEFDPQRLNWDVLRIAETLRHIFERAEAEGAPTSVIADRMAEERLARARARHPVAA
jgi:leucine dehydrogenase